MSIASRTGFVGPSRMAGTSTPVAEEGGVASYAPGSERWIAALQATDADAMRLDRLDVSSMSAEAAARLWARVAAWVESDQIAYYIDDAPVSSDAAYDARMRCLQALEAQFPSLDSTQSPTHRVGGTFSNDFGPLKLARGLGLLALDLCPPARHFLAKRMIWGARAWP